MEINETNKNTITELICNLKIGETLTRPIHLANSTRSCIKNAKRKEGNENKVFSCFESSDKKTCIVTRKPEYHIPDEIKEFLAYVYASGNDELGIKAAELSRKYCV